MVGTRIRGPVTGGTALRAVQEMACDGQVVSVMEHNFPSCPGISSLNEQVEGEDLRRKSTLRNRVWERLDIF